MENEDNALVRIKNACDYVDTRRNITVTGLDLDILRVLVFFEESGQQADLSVITERVGRIYSQSCVLGRLTGMMVQRIVIRYMTDDDMNTPRYYYKLHNRRISLTHLMSVMARTGPNHGLTAREIAPLMKLEWPSADLISSLTELVHERLLIRHVDDESSLVYYYRPWDDHL
jgi:hypothetical protein